MKKVIQALLQRMLGFENYLFYFSRFKIWTLKWDSQEQEGDFNFFLTLLKPTDQVLDIGANIGIMTALMAKTCPQGKVFAFEPVPENVKAWHRVVASMNLQNTQMFPLALGAETSVVEMEMPLMKGVRMQGLSHIRHQTIAGYEEVADRYQVKQIPLDDCQGLPDRIDAIKMDVENYEQYVLMGARKLLARHQPLIYCELWENENRERCFEILRQLDYKIMILEQDQLQTFQVGVHGHHNFFFIPAARVSEFL
ncbi:MAG: FkbM family methyltransferase [Bacteroidota bacterium]